MNKIKPRLSWSMFHKSVQEEETEGLLVSPCSFRLGFPIILRFGSLEYDEIRKKAKVFDSFKSYIIV